MTYEGYICSVNLRLHHVCSPGARLYGENCLYLLVELFNTPKRTEMILPCFPLLVDRSLVFTKLLRLKSSPSTLYDILENCNIRVELREDPLDSTSIKLLAFYSHNAWRFLVGPYYKRIHSIVTREIFLRRTVDFKGPPIRMKITAETTIQKVPVKTSHQLTGEPIDTYFVHAESSYLTDLPTGRSPTCRNCSDVDESQIASEDATTMERINKKVKRTKVKWNPIELLVTSSSFKSKNNEDYGEFIYPADRLKSSGLVLIEGK
uniref:Spermatogenesis-associated protein 6 N-terminal domain-containing protein n=2 Tax=Trichobilharzia regenti TaxID=157069 RepID=A0AA85J3K3_TRIRE|nr:unnamed protein product [Trichobilharzia regenti]